jgi:hypothetical protein
MTKLDFESWLQAGVEAGFVGVPVCYTHDGLPTTQAEDEEFEEGDPCIHIIRCYEDEETKLEVEANHSPSVWRKGKSYSATSGHNLKLGADDV